MHRVPATAGTEAAAPALPPPVSCPLRRLRSSRAPLCRRCAPNPCPLRPAPSLQPEAGGGRYSASLTLPRELAPVTLAFVMHVLPPGGEGGPGRYITPLSGAHFSELVGMQPGAAEPLGACGGVVVGGWVGAVWLGGVVCFGGCYSAVRCSK